MMFQQFKTRILQKAFNVLQDLIKDRKIKAGHDIGSGGLITTLLEMCFADDKLGALIDLTSLGEKIRLKRYLMKTLLLFSKQMLKWKQFSLNIILKFSKNWFSYRRRFVYRYQW